VFKFGAKKASKYREKDEPGASFSIDKDPPGFARTTFEVVTTGEEEALGTAAPPTVANMGAECDENDNSEPSSEILESLRKYRFTPHIKKKSLNGTILSFDTNYLIKLLSTLILCAFAALAL
jgi:hypothetical protein